MITFVYIAENKDLGFEDHLKDSSGLDDVEILHFRERNYAKAYNEALKIARYDHIIFVRDDVEIHSRNWGGKILSHFEKTNFGILGVVGSIIVPMSGLVWEKEEPLVGRIWYENYDTYNENKFSEVFTGKVIPVITIDDAFFAVDRKKLKTTFDEQFSEDSFYDIDFCLSNFEKKGKIGVIFDIKVLKKEFNDKDDSWRDNRNAFVKKHQQLPNRIKPEILVNKSGLKIENPPKVTMLIANKNKPVELASCLESIYEKTQYLNLEIIIIDLGSKDEDLQAVENFIVNHGNTKIIQLKSDHLPDVYDEAINTAVSPDTELLFFCDSEVIFINDVVSRLVKVYTENPQECGTLGVRMHMRNNMLRHFGLQLFSRETEDGHELGLGYQGFQSAYKYKNKVVKNILGSSKDCLMISKSLFHEIGGFNKDYLHNLDDFELNLMTILHGKKNILVGNAVCYYLGREMPKFLPDDFMTLVNFVNNHSEVITPYVNLVYAA